MMERNFHTDEFEELIRQKTGQYKMYPSDKVWKEIYNSLHTKRRRFVIGMSVLIGGILMVAGIELLQPSKHPETVQKIQPPEPLKPGPAIDLSAFVALKKATTLHRLAVVAVTGNPDAGQALEPSTSSSDQLTTPGASDILEAYADPASYSLAQSTDGNLALTEPAGASRIALAEPKGAPGETLATLENLTTEINVHLPLHQINNSVSVPTDEDNLSKASRASGAVANSSPSQAKQQINWLQEYAVQHLVAIKQHRVSFQIYFSPTVNYRNLSGANYDPSKPTVANVPVALAHYGNVNDFVDHTPAIGYEVGSSILYRLTRNLTFKIGAQFNYSSYNIRAYSSGDQLGTIALNSPYFTYFGYLADSVSSYSNVRNFGGKSRITLQNKYYQLSMPIGLEYKMFGNGRLQFFIAGTIQPTYLLNRNSYLLTTDYTSYIKEPSLFRVWNVNGGLEAYVAYQAAGLRWQIGPQFRYQLLSTYTDDYPLKENLKEYGIKIGISKIFH
jgi:hypothetical protein